jgi:hypothetical protein
METIVIKNLIVAGLLPADYQQNRFNIYERVKVQYAGQIVGCALWRCDK